MFGIFLGLIQTNRNEEMRSYLAIFFLAFKAFQFCFRSPIVVEQMDSLPENEPHTHCFKASMLPPEPQNILIIYRL